MTTTPSSSRDESKIETDITIYGGTSFVARHILHYLMDLSPSLPRKLKVTLAGRNETKLRKVKEANYDGKLKQVTEKDSKDNDDDNKPINDYSNIELDFCIANSTDHDALHKMTARTRCIINCAGPFELYSSGVVQACADTGCDYVDITGEVQWSGAMRIQHGAAAAKSGARIISLCGFDSVPSDLSVFCAVQALRQVMPDAQVNLARTWHDVFGMAGGGTLATMKQMEPDIGKMFFDSNNKLRKVPLFVFDPLVLTHPETIRFNPDYEEHRHHMAATEWWNCLPYPHTIFQQGVSIPFFMAAANSKVVNASALALGYNGKPSTSTEEAKKNNNNNKFSYYERYVPLGLEGTLGFGLFSTIPSLIVLGFLALCGLVLQLPFISDLLLKWVAPPGSGASDDMCRRGHAEVYAEVKAPLEGQPGNGAEFGVESRRIAATKQGRFRDTG